MPVIDITTKQLEKLISEKKEKLEIIDVREPQEYQIVRLANSKLIPMDEVIGRKAEIDWKKDVVLVCRSGSRSGIIADMLDDGEKTVLNLGYGLYDYYREGNRDDLEINEGMIGMYF